MKKILLLLFLLLVNYSYCQNDNAENMIKSTINSFFEGLHKGDTTIINKTINTSIKMQTVFVNKEGQNVLRTETKKDFLFSVSNKRAEDIWLEKLVSISINIDGNLASVWTPYEFYFNNKFSHCGVNSFQLFNNNGNWEIIYLVDTRRNEGCEISP